MAGAYDDRDGVIWMDGAFVPWREAKVHVLTHALHYASAVFEGERAYGGTIFKSAEHTTRLLTSCDLLEMPHPFSFEEIEAAKAEVLVPEILFVPLVGFTPTLARLGQGGGHYDRWLAEHPPLLAIGLAWDAQACDALPTEPHDVPLDAVVTPTRIFGLNLG